MIEHTAYANRRFRRFPIMACLPGLVVNDYYHSRQFVIRRQRGSHRYRIVVQIINKGTCTMCLYLLSTIKMHQLLLTIDGCNL